MYITNVRSLPAGAMENGLYSHWLAIESSGRAGVYATTGLEMTPQYQKKFKRRKLRVIVYPSR